MFWLNDIFSHSSHVVVIAVCVSSALKQPLRSIHTVTRSLPSLHAGTNQLIFERSELNCFSHLSFQFNHSLLTDVHSTVYMSPEASRTEGSDSGSFRKKKRFWSGPKPHITACVTHCEPDPDLLDVLYMSNSKPRYFTPFFSPHTHTWNMHYQPHCYYSNEKVVFISRLVPHTAQIDLPCYVSDQITRKPALTSAFGIKSTHCFSYIGTKWHAWISVVG